MKAACVGLLILWSFLAVRGDAAVSSCDQVACYNDGTCDNSTTTCNCSANWTGSHCELCTGRTALIATKGTITSGLGETYAALQHCTWVISRTGGTYLHFQLTSLETECGWDHVYVYNGSSANDAILAIYSGVKHNEATILTTKADYITVFFSPDSFVHLGGFNASFSSDDCPAMCVNGACNPMSKFCICDQGYYGDSCVFTCPDCGAYGSCKDGRCVCEDGYNGPTCSTDGSYPHWRQTSRLPDRYARIGASMAMIGGDTYIYGGLTLGRSNDDTFLRVDDGGEVTVLPADPGPRGHAALVVYKAALYLVGGQTESPPAVLSDFWTWSPVSESWAKLPSLPWPVTLHTAHTHSDTIYVFFGYNLNMLLVEFVQVYKFSTGNWTVELTPLRGLAGHSSSLRGDDVFFSGGHSFNRSGVALVQYLWRYSLLSGQWFDYSANMTLLQPQRSYHSLAALPSGLVNFGGRVDGDSQMKCQRDDSTLANLANDCYTTIQTDGLTRLSPATFVSGDKVILFGGYADTLLSDFVTLNLGTCFAASNSSQCTDERCMWECGACYPVLWSRCPHSGVTYSALSTPGVSPLAADTCAATPEFSIKYTGCIRHSNCYSCLTDSSCLWMKGNICVDRSTGIGISNISSIQQCYEMHPSCSSLENCTDCAVAGCLWCANQETCIDKSLLPVVYPYGQCYNWRDNPDTCASGCISYANCSLCHADPACGWCHDEQNTGMGSCLSGAVSGDGNSTCRTQSWFWETCPLCQCSGHASCATNSSTCGTCRDNTQGEHCETCADGFTGNALNGGVCKPCNCSERGVSCDPYSGHCHCDTHGADGDMCETCQDKFLKFDADCFYLLAIGYRYTITINTTTPSEAHVTRANFVITNDNYPDDLTRKRLEVNCSEDADAVLMYATDFSNRVVMHNFTCRGEDTTFDLSAMEPESGMGSNYTLWLEISNFTAPCLIGVLYQEDNRSIYQYLIVLFSVFLLALLIILSGFQLKRYWERLQQRQQSKVEMVQMRQRPYSEVSIDLTLIKKQAFLTPPSVDQPPLQLKPISAQPLASLDLAVFTSVLRLPTGGTAFHTDDAPALLLASTLTEWEKKRN